MPHQNRNNAHNWPEFLVSFRARHNLTQAKLADELQISRRTVEDWEAGRRKPIFFLNLALERVEQRLLLKPH